MYVEHIGTYEWKCHWKRKHFDLFHSFDYTQVTKDVCRCFLLYIPSLFTLVCSWWKSTSQITPSCISFNLRGVNKHFFFFVVCANYNYHLSHSTFCMLNHPGEIHIECARTYGDLNCLLHAVIIFQMEVVFTK